MDVLFLTDSKIPNNYILRKSRILKDLGHKTFLEHNNPDHIIVSGIWKKNNNDLIKRAESYNCPVEYGGIAFDYRLDNAIDNVQPDYSLMDVDYSIGHTTRGCPNNCYFCMVPRKEGTTTYRVQKIEDFHDPTKNTVMLLDSNILQDKEWFLKNTDFLLDNKLLLIEHGFDVRSIDHDMAKRIKELKFYSKTKKGVVTNKGSPKFAFDNIKDVDRIIKGIKILREYKIKGSFYIYCHNEDQIEDAIQRKEIVQEYKQDWHIMSNQDVPQTKLFKDFKRWGSRPAISRGIKFEDYTS